VFFKFGLLTIFAANKGNIAFLIVTLDASCLRCRYADDERLAQARIDIVR
jgi:hypothetical protein